ncbi:stress-activated map kinase interacting protein 1-domain-containing protein [Amylocystis lapponica]|nr:stress-activated map kinase interacting protein 1-domain-containing protein [Amylocystis lapponica]
MSLLSDPEFLIHSMRLNYLRNVDDLYGPRIISLDPSFQSNPYIVASGLADVERWPELAMPSSPAPSDDEAGTSNRSRRHSGFPGATGLKYTTTIMGPSRAGAMGLRVSGKRASLSKNSFRYSVRSESEISEATTAVEGQKAAVPSPAPVSTPSTIVDSVTSPSQDKDAHTNGTSPSGKGASVHEDHDIAKEISPQFVPKFKGAAEMEARRRLRMLARTPPGGEPKPPVATTNLNPEISSSSSSSSDEDEDDLLAEDDDEDFDLVADVDDSMEMDGDEFDPEFAASRGINSDSDGVSILSGTNSVMSTSNSSMMASSLVRSGSARARNRLSPVREGRHSEERSAADAALDRPEESAPIAGFEMVTAVPRPEKPRSSAVSSTNDSTTSRSTVPSENLFARRPVPPARSTTSALTAMLAETSSSSSSSNPFAELYSAISGRSESESMSVQVYFPLAREPAGRALDLVVRKDATVEEVLGFALWRYWEEGWLPKLDDGLEGEEDPKWETKCSAVGWILRIAEDDGEVDEDFPPPDRTGKISKFNFDAYAVLEATPAQVQQNKILESKIQRRLSRIVIKKKKSTGLLNATSAATGLAPPADAFLGTSAGLGSLGSSLGMFPSSLGPSSSHGPPMFLRIGIADMAGAGHFSTTIQASGGMYMAEVLEAVCQKRKLGDPKDHALILDIGGTYVYIPLDRTVKSLQGKRDLTLVRKDTLLNYGVEMGQSAGRTTDPNASIFKRNSESREQGFSSVFDYTNAYRKYTVYRKVPMLVTRSERLLAIDGGYIHIIPMSNKAKHVFDSGKTPSYHLSSVIACQQSRKNSSTFKLVVHSDAERTKRYDFEAENPKMANEIVQTIRGLKTAMERPGSAKQSRRSRQVT